MANIVVERGEIFYADLSPVIGSEQGGIRPVVVIQNAVANRYAPTVIVSAITAQIDKAKLPTHVEISSEEYGLNRDSVVLLEQIRTLDKRRLKEKIGHITEKDMKKIDEALSIAIELNDIFNPSVTNSEEIKEINNAIKILKNIADKYNIKDTEGNKKLEKEYRQFDKKTEIIMEHISNEFNGLYENFSGLSEDMQEMTTKINPLIEKQKIAKGKLTEFAVIDFFKFNHYEANKANDEFDHLKIDVIAKNNNDIIYIQVKSGQISNKEIITLVKNVKEIEEKYNKNNLKTIACVCAEKFRSDSDIIRINLEQEFNIPIMYIHKYQVLDVCSGYKSTVQ